MWIALFCISDRIANEHSAEFTWLIASSRTGDSQKAVFLKQW